MIFIQRWAFNVFIRPNVLGLSTERPVFMDKRTGQEAGQGKERDSTDWINEKTSIELLLLRFSVVPPERHLRKVMKGQQR